MTVEGKVLMFTCVLACVSSIDVSDIPPNDLIQNNISGMEKKHRYLEQETHKFKQNFEKNSSNKPNEISQPQKATKSSHKKKHGKQQNKGRKRRGKTQNHSQKKETSRIDKLTNGNPNRKRNNRTGKRTKPYQNKQNRKQIKDGKKITETQIQTQENKKCNTDKQKHRHPKPRRNNRTKKTTINYRNKNNEKRNKGSKRSGKSEKQSQKKDNFRIDKLTHRNPNRKRNNRTGKTTKPYGIRKNRKQIKDTKKIRETQTHTQKNKKFDIDKQKHRHPKQRRNDRTKKTTINYRNKKHEKRNKGSKKSGKTQKQSPQKKDDKLDNEKPRHHKMIQKGNERTGNATNSTQTNNNRENKTKIETNRRKNAQRDKRTNNEKLAERRKNAVRNPRLLWDNAEVPYVMSHEFTKKQRKLIKKSINFLEKKTCVRFYKYSERKASLELLFFVRFQRPMDDFCESAIGKVKVGGQDLNLGNSCFDFITVTHEIVHALGFEHQHVRYDRNKYIHVNYDNLKYGRGIREQFEKVSNREYTTLGVKYNRMSIMHYRPWEFQKNNNIPVLSRIGKDGRIYKDEKMGESKVVPYTDILMINKLYNCKAHLRKGRNLRHKTKKCRRLRKQRCRMQRKPTRAISEIK